VSKASERKTMIDSVAGYALMGVPELAELLGCSVDVAHGLDLPWVIVGKRKKVDPVDAGVFILAQREDVTPAEYWDRLGEGQTVENVRRYFLHAARVKNVGDAA